MNNTGHPGEMGAIEAFVERWRDTGGKERAKYQLFLTELSSRLACQARSRPVRMATTMLTYSTAGAAVAGQPSGRFGGNACTRLQFGFGRVAIGRERVGRGVQVDGAAVAAGDCGRFSIARIAEECVGQAFQGIGPALRDRLAVRFGRRALGRFRGNVF